MRALGAEVWKQHSHRKSSRSGDTGGVGYAERHRAQAHSADGALGRTGPAGAEAARSRLRRLRGLSTRGSGAWASSAASAESGVEGGVGSSAGGGLRPPRGASTSGEPWACSASCDNETICSSSGGDGGRAMSGTPVHAGRGLAIRQAPSKRSGPTETRMPSTTTAAAHWRRHSSTPAGGAARGRGTGPRPLDRLWVTGGGGPPNGTAAFAAA